jgi:hypothetical protein
VQVLAHFFRNTTSLTSLNIGFGRDSEDFFKKWSINAPQTNLSTLHLRGTATRYKNWAAYIGSCGDNLKTLILDRMTLTGSNELRLVFQFLTSRSLGHCVLRKFTVDGKQLWFGKIHESMPETQFEHRKVPNGGTDGGDLVEVPRTKYPSDELHLYNSHDGDDEVDRGLGVLLEFSMNDLSATSRLDPWLF